MIAIHQFIISVFSQIVVIGSSVGALLVSGVSELPVLTLVLDHGVH